MCTHTLPLDIYFISVLFVILCRFGPRFPAMTTAYDRELRRFAKQAAFDLGMDSFIREGVYVHISGPNYETPSESIFLRNIGADAVGMSTAPEVTVARHADIRVLGKRSFCASMLHIIQSTTLWFHLKNSL